MNFQTTSNVNEALQHASLRIKPLASAARLWEGVLTPSERIRLGDDLEAAYAARGTVGMWRHLRPVSVPHAIVEIAHKLQLLMDTERDRLMREIGEESGDLEAAIAGFVARDGLVLTERPRAVYWKRKKVPIDWEKYVSSWNFIFELSRFARMEKPIDRLTFGDEVHEDYVANQKHRLVKLTGFPKSLAKLIVPIGRGTQKLDLLPEQIRIFELETIEVLRELYG